MTSYLNNPTQKGNFVLDIISLYYLGECRVQNPFCQVLEEEEKNNDVFFFLL